MNFLSVSRLYGVIFTILFLTEINVCFAQMPEAITITPDTATCFDGSDAIALVKQLECLITFQVIPLLSKKEI